LRLPQSRERLQTLKFTPLARLPPLRPLRRGDSEFCIAALIDTPDEGDEPDFAARMAAPLSGIEFYADTGHEDRMEVLSFIFERPRSLQVSGAKP